MTIEYKILINFFGENSILKKSRIFILIFLLIVIWIQSPVKVLDDQENIINSDITESINEKDNVFVYYTTPDPTEETVNNVQKPTPKFKKKTRPTPKFKKMTHPKSKLCDGRIYCSQMSSCDEAKYFIQNFQVLEWMVTVMVYLVNDSIVDVDSSCSI